MAGAQSTQELQGSTGSGRTCAEAMGFQKGWLVTLCYRSSLLAFADFTFNHSQTLTFGGCFSSLTWEMQHTALTCELQHTVPLGSNHQVFHIRGVLHFEAFACGTASGMCSGSM